MSSHIDELLVTDLIGDANQRHGYLYDPWLHWTRQSCFWNHAEKNHATTSANMTCESTIPALRAKVSSRTRLTIGRGLVNTTRVEETRNKGLNAETTGSDDFKSNRQTNSHHLQPSSTLLKRTYDSFASPSASVPSLHVAGLRDGRVIRLGCCGLSIRHLGIELLHLVVDDCDEPAREVALEVVDI